MLSGTEAVSSRHNTRCRDITCSSGANVSMRANETFQGARLKSIPLSKHSIKASITIFSVCVCAEVRDAVIGHMQKEITWLSTKMKAF